MPYIAPEVIERARQIDLLTYLETFEPGELVRISPNNYTTKSHDSLKISNGKWMWWSRRIGGYNALDYLVKVRGISFVEAVETLMGKAAHTPSLTCAKPKRETPKVLLLPEKSPSTDRITEYLFSRGIDYGIIEYCIANQLIYESLPYHNIVFVGRDRENRAKYAAYRATSGKRIMGDCAGSDKHYSFRIEGEKGGQLHLFECAIDLLSYATFERIWGRNWREHSLVSLAGVYSPKEKMEESTVPAALATALRDKSDIEKIHLHLDNDNAGRKAAEALKVILSDRFEVIDSPPKMGKDLNDSLCLYLGIKKDKTPERRSYER